MSEDYRAKWLDAEAWGTRLESRLDIAVTGLRELGDLYEQAYYSALADINEEAIDTFLQIVGDLAALRDRIEATS